MKILFLTRSFYPNIGGVEKHILEISKLLIEKSFDVHVVAEMPQKSYSEFYQRKTSSAKHTGSIHGIKTYYINPGKNNWFKKFRIWIELYKYKDLIKSSDVVHCHDVFFWYLPFRLIFPFKKIYTTFHGYEGNNLPTKKAILMHKIAEKFSKGNICVGDFLKKWYGTKPTFITYGAVDDKLLKNFRSKTEFEKDVAFIGRLEEETSILEYLKAINELRQKKIDLSMDVYGDGSLRREAEAFVVTNKLRVSFKGFVPKIENYLLKYKYIFVSRYLSILEAMAVKKPVFAQYNNEIKKDYLQMAPFAGYISISKDAKELSGNMENYMLFNRGIDINKGYSWVKPQTWDNMVNIYIKLWNLS